MSENLRRLETWVAKGLITNDQAAAIRAFEATRGRGVARGRIPLVTEALGYLGTALAFAAAGVALGQSWDSYPAWLRIAIPAGCAILLFSAGWLLRTNPEPAYRRFAAALWFLSVAGFGWFIAELLVEGFEVEDNVLLAVGVGVTVYAVLLYVSAERAILQIAMFAGVLLFTGALMARFAHADGDPGGWVGAGFAVVGMSWLGLGWAKLLAPRELALGLGSAAALFGCQMVATMPASTHAGLVIGLAVSASLLATSVWLRDNVLLGFGAVGSFGFLLGTVAHFFGDTLGAPLVLLSAGLILLAVALLTMRLRRFTGSPPPAAHAM